MNTGLQDAYNLGWKLALVVKGQADAALLDSYEGERLPVARRLLQTTDQAFKLVVSDSALAGLLRTQVLARIAALAMRFERVRRFAFRTVSQTGIAYRRSALSSRSWPKFSSGPRPGDRFPWLRLGFQAGAPAQDLFEHLSDLRFNLLLFGQMAPAANGLPADEWLDTHVMAESSSNQAALARADIPRLSFYLLRPDGHIACCGLRLDMDAIRAWFDKVRSPRPGSLLEPP